MTKYNLAGQDLQLQIDHPAARSLMVLLAVNLMVLPTASAQRVVLNNAGFEFSWLRDQDSHLEATANSLMSS